MIGPSVVVSQSVSKFIPATKYQVEVGESTIGPLAKFKVKPSKLIDKLLELFNPNVFDVEQES